MNWTLVKVWHVVPAVVVLVLIIRVSEQTIGCGTLKGLDTRVDAIENSSNWTHHKSGNAVIALIDIAIAVWFAEQTVRLRTHKLFGICFLVIS